MSGWLVPAVVIAVIVIVFVIYLSMTAGRLDRLHHRVEAGFSSMDIQFLRRSGCALEAAESGVLDPATSLVLMEAAHNARAVPGDPIERAQMESDLTRVLAAAFGSTEDVNEIAESDDGSALIGDLSGSVHRAAMSRRFYNDAVRACRAVRRQRLVRWFRLAGSAPYPQSAELDDSVPAGLVDR